MQKGIFITGTDTEVGKTFVATGLLMAFRKMGINVCPMKPVETGCRVKNGKLVPEDAIKLINASGVKEPLEIINPYRFRYPLAPSIAAELEKVSIKKKKILSTYNYLSKKYDFVIVEGAGGIMVPLYKEYLFIDLIKDLNLPVIIISRPGLGTINHTLLTIEAARNKGIKVSGVIINYSDKIKKGICEKTNPVIISKLGGVQILGIVQYSEKHASATRQKIFLKVALSVISNI